ncbi:GGDEF domain-containing protein [Marinobacterium sp. AK62]|uniref:GGDEF domain-containing protein n=1 Tax=Marinobacterium alkalitolerans TaxID=1542925 RepID=A0ABS3ZDS9_9GAMM|nr:sensor domain-containing diguanylate cyclase [Marinobacterium alkalitolerans]MBP0049855.1 GGDEF domain-containing protein [Marinobacterium alkalitolerans]
MANSPIASEKLREVIHIHTDVIKLGHSLGDIIQLVTDRTLGLVDADGAAIELAENNEMVYRAASGIARDHLGLRLKRKNSFSGLSAETGKVMYCPDSERDPHADREACRKIGMRSMVAVPLIHGDTCTGVLKAMAKAPEGFDAGKIELLELLSELVASAMYFATHFNDSDIYYQATHDPLTSLANRSLFMDRLRKGTASCLRSRQLLGLVMLDVDDLKLANDRYGHRLGDALLLEIANRCTSVCRSTDTVARLGGDEFCLILTPIKDRKEIECFLKRLKKTLAPPLLFDDIKHEVNTSIGTAVFPEDSDSLDQLIETADARMYEDKRNRKASKR